jgi:hypothetical protein
MSAQQEEEKEDEQTSREEQELEDDNTESFLEGGDPCIRLSSLLTILLT